MKTAGNVLSVVLLLVMTVAVSWSDGEFPPPELVSVSDDGRGEFFVLDDLDGSVTKDGRYVVFIANRIPLKLYIRDRLKKTTTILDTSGYGELLIGIYSYPNISENGRYIFFTTKKDWKIDKEFRTTYHIFRHDTKTKQVVEVTLDEKEFSDGYARRPYSVSSDGNIVAFYASLKSDNPRPDMSKIKPLLRNRKGIPSKELPELEGYARIVVKNILTGEVKMTNRINNPISAVSISGDGSVISYQRVVKGEEHGIKKHSCNRSVPQETVYYSRLLEMEWVIPGIHSYGNVQLSGDGRFIAFYGFSDSYPQITTPQVYVYDVQNMSTELASVSNKGQLLFIKPLDDCFPWHNVRFSDDGRYVVFVDITHTWYRRDMVQKVTQTIIELHESFHQSFFFAGEINSDASYLLFTTAEQISSQDRDTYPDLYIQRMGPDEFSEAEESEVWSGNSSGMNNRKQGNGSSSGGGFPPAGNNDESSSLRPEVQASLSQTEIWPPNQKEVSLTLSGSVSTAGTCEGIRLSLSVVDEYNAYGFNSGIPIASDCSFSTMVTVEAWRDGQDMDGRKYTFSVTATNSAGKTSMELNAIVPHDQGN